MKGNDNLIKKKESEYSHQDDFVFQEFTDDI